MPAFLLDGVGLGDKGDGGALWYAVRSILLRSGRSDIDWLRWSASSSSRSQWLGCYACIFSAMDEAGE